MKPILRAPLHLPVDLTVSPEPVPDVVSSQPLLAPAQTRLLQALFAAGGTATTAQLHQTSAIPPRETFAYAVSLAAFGLVTLQQHPLLPNHATLSVTPFGRRVAAERRDGPDADQAAPAERRLRLLPGPSISGSESKG